jgi:hypothetical protein
MTTIACRKCGLPLAFKVGPNGKLWPINPDGSDHFDVCSKGRSAHVRKIGRPFETEHEAGFIMPDGKRHLTRQSGKAIVGLLHAPSRCASGVPPWELCSCVECVKLVS